MNGHLDTELKKSLSKNVQNNNNNNFNTTTGGVNRINMME